MAGLWSGLGALLFEALVVRGGVARDLQPYYFLIGGLPFFWIPLFLFVFGGSGEGGIRNLFECAGRGLCWLGGAGIVLMVGIPLIGSLHAS